MRRGSRAQRFKSRPPSSIRGGVDRLLVLLPDQLHRVYLSAAGLDRADDAVLQMELFGDFTHVPSHTQRIAPFLAAMRHFAVDMERAGWLRTLRALEETAENLGLTG